MAAALAMPQRFRPFGGGFGRPQGGFGQQGAYGQPGFHQGGGYGQPGFNQVGVAQPGLLGLPI